ncbi:GNAT family N-acetyltransferase [Neobacillus sp. NRS-1170]|uniref:GNAT family N-acetyltransferase n=1 Tax=Neobacillus sp. NRS-1170 TaxID=3233898 RepID=UPI003D2BBA50
MIFETIHQWDEKIWEMVSPIYHHAFAEKGAKPEKIIRNMFRKEICFLHLGFVGEQIVSMSLTGKLKGTQALLIDYLAVHHDYQNQGYGLKTIKYIKEWSKTSGSFDSMVIEVESEATPENLVRIHFWQKCGFVLTDYIHHYIWVPEPYQAMFLKLSNDAEIQGHGKLLFKYIGQFHKASYQDS